MIITKKHLSRRTVLRSMGAVIALPLLDSMVPALTAQRLTAARAIRRLCVVYAPMGMNMAKWTPATEGQLVLSPILQPLASFKDRLLVVSGLDSWEAARIQDAGLHTRAQATWATGVKPKQTEGGDFYLGISMDQVAAQDLGKDTQLASLELSLETADTINAGCAQIGYSCVYNNTIAWRTPTAPLPVEVNPRALFERMFGGLESTDSRARLAQRERDRSILDAVTEKMARLRLGLGPDDNRKIDEYFEAVRDVERRLQKAEAAGDVELPVVERPRGVPDTYEAHAKVMFDLLALAYQTDLTRVSTFMLGRELSNRTFPEIGVPDAWHSASHHQNDPGKLERQAKLNSYQLGLFAYFLEKLRSTPDGDGSMLDTAALFYGSGMSNSNLHINLDLPNLVVSGKSTQITGGQHVRCPARTPLANLQLAVLQKLGIPVERFGDSSEALVGV